MGHGLLIHEVSRAHNDAPQSVGLWMSDQIVAETSTWQHSQQTNVHHPGGIRTHKLSRRATADLRFRPRGHWDRLSENVPMKKRTLTKNAFCLCFFKGFFFLTYFAKYTKRDVLINARRFSYNKWGHKICPVQLKTEATWNFFYWLLQCGTSLKYMFVGSRAVTSVKKGWKDRLTVEATLMGVY
jgi:hypothetical protein